MCITIYYVELATLPDEVYQAKRNPKAEDTVLIHIIHGIPDYGAALERHFRRHAGSSETYGKTLHPQGGTEILYSSREIRSEAPLR